MKLHIPKKKTVKLSLREKKHQANLRKNNGLYFQIGLILALFISFGVFQLKFEKKNQMAQKIILQEEIEVANTPIDYIIEELIPKKEVAPNIETLRPDLTNPTMVDNDVPVVETIVDVPIAVVDEAPKVNQVRVIDEDPEIDTYPVSLVSELPVFPGCEKLTDKEEQFECFSKKIARIINKKFDADIAVDNGITGRQKITVTFVINNQGNVVNVKARAPHPKLEAEAVKAVKALPQMTPAKQGYKTVNVSYALPIIFEVQ